MGAVDLLHNCRLFFNQGNTQSFDFRKTQLVKLKEAIVQHEEEIYTALFADLKKSREECWVTENGLVLSEIDHILDHLKEWMRPESRSTNLVNLPSRSYITREPLGVVLVIGPWNYPFQLMMKPIIGAIAAGNCVVAKPSEFAPATAALIKKIIESLFPTDFICWVEGDGATVIPEMMKNFAFDLVFFTGSTTVGKLIYKMAAENLTPVILELGGKSPCLILEDANIMVAARRIAVTKFSNAGQMCVAPDYILVPDTKKEALLQELKKAIHEFYGADPAGNDGYCRIVNQKQFDRLIRYLNEGKILLGGDHDRDHLYIAPTLLDQPSMESAVMKEEIFGPILPIISYKKEEEVLSIISSNKNPLAFYVFTADNKKANAWLKKVPSGGACINNASWHFANDHLPVGGRGNSGMGSYHGKESFDAFSHAKSVMRTPTWFDPSVKYPPFKGKLRLFKWFIR
jgi:aldehyde dehydrogenase (NAD+)